MLYVSIITGRYSQIIGEVNDYRFLSLLIALFYKMQGDYLLYIYGGTVKILAPPPLVWSKGSNKLVELSR